MTKRSEVMKNGAQTLYFWPPSSGQKGTSPTYNEVTRLTSPSILTRTSGLTAVLRLVSVESSDSTKPW